MVVAGVQRYPDEALRGKNDDPTYGEGGERDLCTVTSFNSSHSPQSSYVHDQLSHLPVLAREHSFDLFIISQWIQCHSSSHVNYQGLQDRRRVSLPHCRMHALLI